MKAITPPPVGLVPRFIRLEQRNTEIYEAMQRYAEAEKPVPLAWVLELADNNSQLLRERDNPGHNGNTVRTVLAEHVPLFVQLTDNNSSLHLIQPNNIVQIYQTYGNDRTELGLTCVVLSSGPNIYINVDPDEVLRRLGIN
jgi:hypothetical protein